MFMKSKCIFCRLDVPTDHYAKIIFDVGSQYSYIAHWACLSTESSEEAYVVDYSQSHSRKESA